MPKIEDRLMAIVERQFGLEPGRVTHDTRLPDLGDSLEWYSLLSALEDAFGIEISDEEGLSVTTLDDVLRLVQKVAVA